MGSIILHPLLTIFLLSPALTESQTIQSTRLLDLLIRDYTFKSFDIHLKTGIVQKIHLPSNFSGISIDTVRFRCGSLTRYGARIGEFHLGSGVTVQPCGERVMLVKQNLGSNWSSIYSTGYNLTGNYQFVSPVLGLLAYNANPDGVASNPYEINILGTEQNPILIDFLGSKASKNPKMNSSVLCACFGSNGKMTLREQVSPYVCNGTRQGHYALVTKAPKKQEQGQEHHHNRDHDRDHDSDGDDEATGKGVVGSPVVRRSGISRWKVAVGSVIGAAIGAFLLGLLMVAMLVKVKKKAMREEMERRAYEEEALQVSMVGHVRAPTASGTRTVPRIEDRCMNYHPS